MRKYCLMMIGLLGLGMGECKAQLTDLLNFNYWGNGGYPAGNLILSGGKLYGTTRSGGNPVGEGTVFSMDTNGNGYKQLIDFNIMNGNWPEGFVTLSNGKLFGMAPWGGLYDEGVIFSVDSDGNGYKDLFDFSISDGYWPFGSLILSGSKLYGMTSFGDLDYFGNLFSIDTDGSGFRILWSFGNTEFNSPEGSLILSNGVLFGMASGGGPYSGGGIFRIDTNGNNKHFFHAFRNATGDDPVSDLLLIGNVLYGMTSMGGTYNDGTIFSIDTNGDNYKTLFNFNGISGANPGGSLKLLGGAFYGMTFSGGVYDSGCIFSIDTGGTNYTDMYDFNTAKGKNPRASLTLSGNMLYGTATTGGGDSLDPSGVVFSFCPIRLKVSAITNVNNAGDSSGSASVTAYGIGPYTYKWMPSGGGDSIAAGLSAGTYTVTVTNGYGCTDTVSIVIKNLTGIENLSDNQGLVSIYPNPSNGQITVSYSLSADGYVRFSLVDELGQVVFDNTKQNGAGRYNEQLNLESLATGIYTLRMQTSGGTTVKKVVIMHNK